MTASKLIEKIDQRSPEDQAKVIQHAFSHARRHQFSTEELGELAELRAATEAPAEITRLRFALMCGFCGE